MKVLSKWVLCAVCILMFSGCLGKELPQVAHYEINFNAQVLHKEAMQQPNKKAEFQKIILQVSPKIAGQKIAYKSNQNRLEYFANNIWVEPFSVMLESLVIQLQAQGVNAQNLKVLQVLDCYFDSINEEVVVRLLAQNRLLQVHERVEEGEFLRIIEAFERALNKAFVFALQGI